MLVVESNIEEVVRRLDQNARSQVPFAVAQALTRTARDAEAGFKMGMERVLDRPTPFTRRAVGLSPARKTVKPVATVFIKDIQARYLEIQERGGIRRPRRRTLLVPFGARLNQYGNLPRGAVKRLLARPDTFSGTIRGVAGIWQRRKRGRVKLLVAYEPRLAYRPRLKFRETVYRIARSNFDRNFRAALERALLTAR